MSSSKVKSMKRLQSSSIKTIQRSDNSEATIRTEPWSFTGKIPFLLTCNSMEFAETGYLREMCVDLLVNLLMVLHAK